MSKPKDLKQLISLSIYLLKHFQYCLISDIVKFNTKDEDLLTPYYNKIEDSTGDPNGKYKAIRLKFSLDKNVYATMCIRELTKTSTSFEIQSKLSEAIVQIVSIF